MTSLYLSTAVGLLAGLSIGPLLRRLVLMKLRRNLSALNSGNYQPVLDSFADDAVLHFNEGAHRWNGTHRGKAAIEAFLDLFVDARLQGEIQELWLGGPFWRMSIVARFNDHAIGEDGSIIYANRTVLIARFRGVKIIEQYDFYEDTKRIEAFELLLKDRKGSHL